MEAKRRVFASVFEFSGALSQPTPEIGFTAPGQPFGGPIAVTHDRNGPSESFQRSFRHSTSFVGDTRDQINWDRSWHTATSFLARCLTTVGVDAPLPPPIPGLESALADVLDPATRLPGAMLTEDLINWYFQQVRRHFLNELLPDLSVVSNTSKLEEVLPSCVKVLERGHRLYLHGLDFIVKQLEKAEPGSSKPVVQRFRGDLHAIVGNSISVRISVTVKKILAEKVGIVLGVPARHAVHPHLVRSQVRPDTAAREKARNELLVLVQSLHNLGLGGEKLKITFAEVMSDVMSIYIKHTYTQVWSRASPTAHTAFMDNVHDSFYPRTEGLVGGSISDRQSLNPPKPYQASASWCVKDLCEWIENEYSVLVLEVLGKLENTEVDWDHVEKWKKMSIGRLAELRTQELFDIVVDWPNAEGALDDLRTSIDTPQKRLRLTDVFSASLRERLLHPGASTLQILRTYISMIRSFHSLDQSKVLLDRVAYPLQIYLCSREDTVKIIITGLLSDAEDSAGNPIEPGGEKLAELAILLNKGSEISQRADEDLDWNDPEWLPDPVDAGPGYKRSKNVDVIGTLIGVLGSQDVFIKEFQNIVGDHLLRGDGDFEKELKVLGLLKKRFGDAPLQSCEVMIKDIQDSRRVDGFIRRNQKLDPNEQEMAIAFRNGEMVEGHHTKAEGILKPSLHAKILSRLFWPQLQNETYRIPDDITRLQQSYERGFEALKNSRKLTWLHSLGQATVELELGDRVISEEVHTWQATVIWAFQGDHHDEASTTRTVEQLVEHLEMDEALVRNALNFWVSKMVLRETHKDVYAVLEKLNQEDLARSNAQASAAGAATDTSADDTNLMSNDNMTSEKMQMYWQFIQGMLTNSAPQMPLQQIAMMLKMLVVDGFPYSNEELQEFLGQKIVEGELELVKGKYKIKK